MAKERSKRYMKAADLAEDVHRWLADETVSAYRESPISALRRLAKRHRDRLLVATVVVLTTTVTAVALVRDRNVQWISRLNSEIDQKIEKSRLVACRPERPGSDGVQTRAVRPG